MNRKNLTAAVLAGLAGAAGIVGSAQAVNINPDGLGQVLIYPYYTVNGGNDTLVSVVNTSDDAKAIKVRFMEGENSQEVLDFNLYMSRHDVWVAAVVNDFGTPSLVVNDTSCTVPYLYLNENALGIRDGMQEFLPYEMAKDGGSTDISRASEGHFEMIEMGTLVGASAAAATHGATGFPASCATLVRAWTQTDSLDDSTKGAWLTDPTTDMEAPSGGMFGGGSIIHPILGAMISYDAKAINGFASAVVTSGGILHQVPGNTLPSLNSGDGYVADVFMDDGTLESSGTFSRGVDAISYLFMHDQLMNEYTTESIVNGQTEWVITFPTKAFYVYEESSGSATPVAPFTSIWDGSGACEVVVLDTIWNREEARPGDDPGIGIPPIVSPAPPDPEIPGVIPFRLCYETSIIRFGDSLQACTGGDCVTELLGSSNYHTINNEILGFEYGWANIEMAVYPLTNPVSGVIIPGKGVRTLDSLSGLPVTGFAVQRFANGKLEGENGELLLANYAGVFTHKGTRLLSVNLPPVVNP